jgi:MFS family permease
MQREHLDSSYAWVRLAICVLAATIIGIGMWGVVLVLPEIQNDFGVSRSVASIAYACVMVGFAIGNLILGRLVDRIGIAPVLAGTAITMAASFALCAYVNSIWLFMFFQILIGFSAGSGFAPLIADVSHWFLQRRGIAVASAAAGNYFAGAAWPYFLKDVVADHGWRPTFLIIAFVCVICLLPLAAMLRRRVPLYPITVSGPVSSGFGVKSIDLSPKALQFLLAIAGLGCCIAMAMPQVHIVAYCTDLGYGVVDGAQMLSTMLAAGIISRLASGFLADYIGGVRTLLIGSILQCLALFLYIPFNGLASLYVVSLIFGLSQGGIVSSYAIIVREYLPAHEAGRRVGFVLMATIIGMAVGGWMSGWIYDITGSYQTAFINGIVWNSMNITIMIFILTRSGQWQKLATA